jgi:hypothetical protein
MICKHPETGQTVNLLAVDVNYNSPAQGYDAVFQTVLLDPNPSGKDIYPATGNLRLTGFALEKLANEAHIGWDPITSGVREHIRGEYILFEAVAWRKRVDGTIHSVFGHGDIDMIIIKDDLYAEHSKKADKRNFSDPRQKAPYIESAVDNAFRQKRSHMLGLAETEARNRAIRKILNVPNDFTAAELKYPFVVVWYRLQVDFKDPAVKDLALKAQLGASTRLFGKPATPTYKEVMPTSDSSPDTPATKTAPATNPTPAPPTTPTPPPEADGPPNEREATVADFKAMDTENQIETLNGWVKKTKYDMGNAAFKIDELSDNNRLKFLEALLDRPAIQKAA